MPIALAKLDDLVFNRGAIPRAARRNLPRVHRRAMYVGANDLMRLICGACDTALNLRCSDALGQHREWLGRVVAGLHFERGPIDRFSVDARRRTGLKTSEREAGAL